MKRQGVFLLSLDGMPVHRRVTHSIRIAGTHLYTWVERGTVRQKCLAQEHNTMSPARTRTQTTRSGVERTNHEANTLNKINRFWLDEGSTFYPILYSGIGTCGFVYDTSFSQSFICCLAIVQGVGHYILNSSSKKVSGIFKGVRNIISPEVFWHGHPRFIILSKED